MMNEHEIIAKLKHSFPTHIGNDAAVLRPSHNSDLIISKDLLIEDVHFRCHYCTPVEIAHKALHVNLSDMAAMGAQPRYALLGLAIPSHFEPFVDHFLDGWIQACRSENIITVGGDTTASPHKLCISVTILGEAHTKPIQRTGSQCNDIIVTTGPIGHAHLGLTSLEKGISGFEDYKKQLKTPQAQVQEGLWLAQSDLVHSMMDISDGLWTSLTQLNITQNNLGFHLTLDQILNATLIRDCEALNLDPYQTVLFGGEDYSLLFTMRFEEFNGLNQRFEDAFDYPLKTIGQITATTGCHVFYNQHLITVHNNSFCHFS